MSLFIFKKSGQILSFFLLSSILLTIEAQADMSAVAEAYQEAFPKHGSIYLPGQCGRNVKELILELQNKGLETSSASVLFLLSESRQFAGGPILPGSLVPSMSRSYASHWDFHVVLRIQDPDTHESFILDLDSKAEPVPMKQYFPMMFPNQNSTDRLAAIQMREIPSEKYLRAFEIYHQTRDPKLSPDDNYVVGDFRKPNLPEFPVQSLRQFLKQEELKLQNAH